MRRRLSVMVRGSQQPRCTPANVPRWCSVATTVAPPSPAQAEFSQQPLGPTEPRGTTCRSSTLRTCDGRGIRPTAAAARLGPRFANGDLGDRS